MAKSKIPGLSFSWKRALGITKMKRKISKETGIPTTKAGRQRKLGKLLGMKLEKSPRRLRNNGGGYVQTARSGCRCMI